MTVTTLTFTKVNDENGVMTTAPHWQPPAEISAHIKENYIDTGKMVQTVVISEDGVTRNITITFADDTAKIEWKEDPLLLQNAKNRIAYNAEHGITENLA
jgi:hypothetical protein